MASFTRFLILYLQPRLLTASRETPSGATAVPVEHAVARYYYRMCKAYSTSSTWPHNGRTALLTTLNAGIDLFPLNTRISISCRCKKELYSDCELADASLKSTSPKPKTQGVPSCLRGFTWSKHESF